MNNEKKARLIKRQEITQPEPPPAKGTTGKLQASVGVVRGWIRDKNVVQKDSARQMFASLFAQPQPE
ncbi:MAG: hypothetical protein ACKV2V_24515 [Blastocatellia bacterium]